MTRTFNFTRTQAVTLEYIVYVSTPWSAAGSALILWVIYHDDGRHKLRTSVYHRLMVGMSVLDLINSVGLLVMGPWSMPQNTIYDDILVHARGNFSTCAVNGFLVVRTVRVGKQKEKERRRIDERMNRTNG